MTDARELTCWVLSEGKPGMERQCLGLAEAVGLPFEVKRVRPAGLWAAMPAWARPDPRWTLGRGSSRIAPPWPDLLIACGRQSIPFSRAMKYWSRGRTFVVQTQHPRVALDLFDLVVPPRHDQLTGVNVFPIIGAPHPVTPERIARARREFAALFGPLLAPRVGVLIGGASKVHELTAAKAQEIGAQLAALSADRISLMVTLSRRTGPRNAALIREALAGTNAYVWDGSGPNPYEAILGWADALIVTSDSVNMAVEAAATGKPVHVLPLEGGSRKFTRFHQDLEVLGITRPFRGRIEFWSYEPLLETPRVAAEIRRLMGIGHAAPRLARA